jgi:hypothetical protein
MYALNMPAVESIILCVQDLKGNGFKFLLLNGHRLISRGETATREFIASF